MSLRLPRWESLSKDEQVPIINLPLDKDFWITGGPGTGKTVMALYRASQALAQVTRQPMGGQVVFMIYNKSLRKYLDQALLEVGIANAYATTWHSWLYKMHYRMFDSMVPEVSRFEPDWNVVTPAMLEYYSTHGPSIEHLFLDETQDFPHPLLQILRGAAQVVSTFSDPNQRVHEASAHHDAIGRVLRIASRRYRLTRNYRNTKEITAVANLFRDPGQSDTMMEPTRSGTKPEAIEAEDLQQAMGYVARYADNQPELLIGVLVPDFDSQSSVEANLSPLVQRAPMQVYANKNEAFTFEHPGVKLMTYSTAKGLEFDTVFLPLIGTEHAHEPSTDIARNRVFVACTRARNELIFLHTPTTRSWVRDTLVDHAELVDWYTLRDDEGAENEDLSF